MDHKMIASNLQALKVDVINLSHRLDTLLEEVERLAFIGKPPNTASSRLVSTSRKSARKSGSKSKVSQPA